MNYDVISSSSKGNAVRIGDILVDCGVSFKALSKVVNDIKLVLLTHEHSDHFNQRTIKKLADERPALRFGCCKWLVKKLYDAGVEPSKIDVYQVGKIYDYKQFKISPVKLYHDVPQCGYRVYIGKEKALYCTDTLTIVGISAKNYDLYLLEANYDDEELEERIKGKQDKGEYAYEFKVAERHLSKKQCDEFLMENAGENSEYVYLHEHRGD